MSRIPREIFYIQINLDIESEYCYFNKFNEFCIMSAIHNCKNDFKFIIYSNKPIKFRFFTECEDYIKNIIIDNNLMEKMEKLGIGRYSETFKIPHMSDFLRYTYLSKYGGIYIDTDIIIKRNLVDVIDDKFWIIISKENSRTVNCGLIMAHPNVPAIMSTLSSYHSDYRFDKWTYNSMKILGKNIKESTCPIKILSYKEGFNYPNWKELDILLTENQNSFINLFNDTPAHHIVGRTVKKGQELRERVIELIDGSRTNNTYFDWMINKILTEYNL